MSLLYILLGATADILQVGCYTQRLVLRTGQLLLEHLYTCRQVFTGVLGSLIGV
ncbi:hypothetical protein D3C75_1337670 [compost metagenome]